MSPCARPRGPGHPMLGNPALTLKHLEQAAWIVPPMGSVLRHRFELMFQEAGLDAPRRLIETSSILFMTKMLQQSDFVAVVPTEVARYYASYGMVAILPIQLSCTMDAFGIILRKDWLLSPAAKVVSESAENRRDQHDVSTVRPRVCRSRGPAQVHPASTTNSCAVHAAASSDARNTTIAAM